VTDSGYLDARYGRTQRRSSRVRLVAAAVGVAVLVGLVAAVYAWSDSGHVPKPTVSGYRVVSDALTTVDFTVSKQAGQRVSCRVVAQDRYTDVVGSVDVDLAAGPSRVAVHVNVPTRDRAVIGLVDSCRVLG
jgi:Domain of unknown function (DUF4307)